MLGEVGDNCFPEGGKAPSPAEHIQPILLPNTEDDTQKSNLTRGRRSSFVAEWIYV